MAKKLAPPMRFTKQINNKNLQATDRVKIILRAEGVFVFLASLIYYQEVTPHQWGLFFLLFLAPDIGILGYLAGNKVGATLYNMTHSYAAPLLLLGICFLTSRTEWNFISVIWTAHIGFDRALGFGLKYPDGFKHTHLGYIKNKLL